MDIRDIIFWGRKPPEAIKWEEVRRKILKAIEEEKKRRAPIITTPSNVGTLPDVYDPKVYTNTADEDSCRYGGKDVLNIPAV